MATLPGDGLVDPGHLFTWLFCDPLERFPLYVFIPSNTLKRTPATQAST